MFCTRSLRAPAFQMLGLLLFLLAWNTAPSQAQISVASAWKHQYSGQLTLGTLGITEIEYSNFQNLMQGTLAPEVLEHSSDVFFETPGAGESGSSPRFFLVLASDTGHTHAHDGRLAPLWRLEIGFWQVLSIGGIDQKRYSIQRYDLTENAWETLYNPLATTFDENWVNNYYFYPHSGTGPSTCETPGGDECADPESNKRYDKGKGLFCWCVKYQTPGTRDKIIDTVATDDPAVCASYQTPAQYQAGWSCTEHHLGRNEGTGDNKDSMRWACHAARSIAKYRAENASCTGTCANGQKSCAKDSKNPVIYVGQSMDAKGCKATYKTNCICPE